MKKLVLFSFLFFCAFCNSQNIRKYEFKEFRMKVGFPWFNNIKLHPDNESRKTRSGFMGSSIGWEFQYSTDHIISVSYDNYVAAPIPFGPISYEGDFEVFSIHQFAISRNTCIGRLTHGYGVTVGSRNWSYRDSFLHDSIAPPRPYVNRLMTTLSGHFDTYYRVGKAFNVGIIYSPTLLRFNSSHPFRYEHCISIDMNWRFRLSKRKEENEERAMLN